MVRITSIRMAAASATAQAQPQGARADQTAFREIYRELVETNTALSAGSCTLAAERMATRLRAAGFADADLRILAPAEHPKQGNLIATLRGSDRRAKPILLLAHIDVVEANRADWERDPFTLIEESGYFYGRGTSDDKAMAAVFVDSLARYRQQGFRPKRDIKMALTCGEETPNNFKGVTWLLANHPQALTAAFAINEGTGGRLDEQGRHVSLGIQAGEKVYQDFRLEVTNPGGHSSAPVKDNAIYRLAAAVGRVGAYDFPIALNEVTRSYFAATAPLTPGPLAGDLKATGAGTAASASIDRVAAAYPSWNSMMRTTCVATMVEAGHAPNALPQRARANVNCRILPGVAAEDVRRSLERIVGDGHIKVTTVGTIGKTAPMPPLSKANTGPAEKVAARLWPGVPLIPQMATGGTDGRFLNAAGIPTYGLSGMFSGPAGNNAHGLNERMLVRSLYEGRDFLHEVVKLYANGR